MDMLVIHAILTDIFRRVFDEPALELHDAMTANDVEGWDSLNHVALISDVEMQFQIKFKLKELMNMDSVGDLLRLIKAKTNLLV